MCQQTDDIETRRAELIRKISAVTGEDDRCEEEGEEILQRAWVDAFAKELNAENVRKTEGRGNIW